MLSNQCSVYIVLPVINLDLKSLCLFDMSCSFAFSTFNSVLAFILCPFKKQALTSYILERSLVILFFSGHRCSDIWKSQSVGKHGP